MNLCKPFTFIFLCFACSSYAQNLVPNGSFEEVIECPVFFGDINKTPGWFGSIQESGVPLNENPSPDWFHACSTEPALSVPDNGFDYQSPFGNGQGYAGIITYATTPSNVREYLGVQLTQPLMVDSLYHVELKAVKADNVNFYNSSNNLGVKFSHQGTYEYLDEIMNNNANFSYNEIILDTLNWMTISFDFIPDSNYSFLHIGNFFSDEFTSNQITSDLYNRIAYYFIDEVSVKRSNTTNVLNLLSNNVLISPNPTSHSINLEHLEFISEIKLYNALGRIILKRKIYYNNLIIDVSSYNAGVYFIQFTDDNNRTLIKKIVIL